MVLADYQLALKLETQDGIENAPSASDVLTTVEEPTISPDVAQSDARPAAGTHALNRSISGRAEASIAAAVYLVGSRDTGAITPPQDALLQACGLEKTSLALHYVTVDAQVGVFVKGETVAWGGIDSGVVMNYAIPRSGTSVLVLDVTGTPPVDNDALVGATSGATANANGNAVARTAYLYTPVSRTTVLISATHSTWASIAAAEGDVLQACNTSASAATTGWNSASARIVAVSGSGTTRTFECEMLHGTFAVGTKVTYYDVSLAALYGAGGTAPAVSVLASGSGPTATVHMATSGILTKVLGVRGTFGLSGQAGGEVRINAGLRGQYNRPANGSLFSGVTYIGTENVPRLELAACTIDGYPFPTQTLEYAHNGTLTARIDLHKANGVGSVRRTGRDPTMTMDPLMPVPAVYDMVGKQLDNVAVVVHAQVGYAAANMFVLEIPSGQLTQVGMGERDGEVVANVECKGRVVSGQDDQDFRLYAL